MISDKEVEDSKMCIRDSSLDVCLMSGTAPQDKIIDVLSDEQLQRDVYKRQVLDLLSIRDK